MNIILLIYVLVSAAAVFAAQSDKKTLYNATKWLPLFLLIHVVVYKGVVSDYKYLIELALLFSLIGDVFLLFEKRFLYGVAAFLIAHVFYSIAFVSEADVYNYSFAIPIFILTGAYFFVIKKSLKLKLLIPIAIYVLAISVMLWSAANFYFDAGNEKSQFIFFAAVLFTISDATLAWNKFVKNYKYAQLIILPTYYAAQLLFAASVFFDFQ